MARVQTDVMQNVQSLSVEGLVIGSRRGILVSSFNWQRTAGGVVWLIGENGSGKSSLLRVFAGWQRHNQGSVRWSGTPSRSAHYITPSMTVPRDVYVGDWIDYVRSMVPAPPHSEFTEALFPTTASRARRFG